MKKFIEKLNSNPFYLKEIQARNKKSRGLQKVVPSWLGSLVILFIPSFLILYEKFVNGGSHGTLGIQNPLISITNIVLSIYFFYRALAFTTPLFAGEKEKGTFFYMFTTLMKPSEIIMGKFWSVFYPLVKELTVFYSLFSLVLMVAEGGYTSAVIMMVMLFTHAASLAAVIMIALWASAKETDPSKAHSLAFGVIVLLSLLLSIFGNLILWGAMSLVSIMLELNAVGGYSALTRQIISLTSSLVFGLFYVGGCFVYYKFLHKRIAQTPVS